MEKTYKIVAPIGNIVLPKNTMTEKELRDFAGQISLDSENPETWIEKSKKDPIESVIEWFNQLGYSVIKND